MRCESHSRGDLSASNQHQFVDRPDGEFGRHVSTQLAPLVVQARIVCHVGRLDASPLSNQNSHYMREPKQKRSQRTLAKILAAAVELFESQGVDATGIADVAKRAGSSVGSLYGRFDGKVDLVQAVDRLLWERVTARWVGSEFPASGDSQREGSEVPKGSTASVLMRLNRALSPEHSARASINDFLAKEGGGSEGSSGLALLVSEVQEALAAQLPAAQSATAQSAAHGTEVLRFLARIAVDEANAGRGADALPEAAAEDIAHLSVGDSLGEEPTTSRQLAFVIEASLLELGGGARVPEPEPEHSVPAVDPFDIWA